MADEIHFMVEPRDDYTACGEIFEPPEMAVTTIPSEATCEPCNRLITAILARQ